MRFTRYLTLPVIVCFALAIAGCATTDAPPVKEQRYFWPPLPDTPRIEFLGAYTGLESLEKKDDSLLNMILGDEAAPAMLDAPTNVTADGNGKVFLTDQKSPAVLYFDLKGKSAGTFGGQAAGTILQRGSGLGLDADGNLYVGDAQQKKIFVLNSEGKIVAVRDIAPIIENIGGIAVDKARKRIIATDIRKHKVFVLGLDGSIISSIGKRGGGDGEFNYPTAVALDREGNIVVADSMNARVQRFTPDLKFINKFGKRGDGIGEMAVIKGIAVDSEGHIYVTDGKMNKVSIFSDQGEVLLQFGGSYVAAPGASVGPGGFQLPMGIYIDQNDTIYVADQMNSRFHVYQYMNEKYTRENPPLTQK